MCQFQAVQRGEFEELSHRSCKYKAADSIGMELRETKIEYWLSAEEGASTAEDQLRLR